MPQHGITVTPVVQEGDDGEHIVDFNVNQGGRTAIGRDGVLRGYEDDFTEDSEGRSVYEPYLGPDELAESPVVGFDGDSYIDTLLDSDSRISPALEWSVDNMDPSFIDAYNNAVDAGDLDTMHQYLDIILKQFVESGGADQLQTETDESEEEQPLTEEEEVQFNDVLETLSEQEPLGQEAAYQWLESSEQWSQADPCVAAICYATASYHNGDATYEEAIDYVSSQFTERQAARAYKQLFG